MRKQKVGRKSSTRNRAPSTAAEDREARMELALRPKPVADQLAMGFTLRFGTTSSSSTAVAITYQNLLDSWLIAASIVVGYQLFDFIKIRRVTVRAINATNVSGLTTLSIEFPGLNSGQLGSGRQKTQSFLGTAEPAMVSLAPGKSTQASQWQPSSGSNAFVLRISDQTRVGINGALVDVDCSFKNSADVNPQVVANAIGLATPGQLYFGGLDGQRLGATGFQSQFRPVI